MIRTYPKRITFASTLTALLTVTLMIGGCGNQREERLVAQPLALPTPAASSAEQDTTNQQSQNQAAQSSESQAVAQAQDTSQSQMGDEALISMGEEVFSANCARCHQADGTGTSTYPPLANSPVVTDDDPANVIDIVVHGRNQMPGFGNTLPAQDIAAVISYARNTWGNTASVVTADHLSQAQAGGSAQSGGEQSDGSAAQASSSVEENSPAQAESAADAHVAAPSPAGQVIVTQGQGGSVITIRIEIVIDQTGTSAPTASVPAPNAPAADGSGQEQPPNSSSESQAEPSGEAESAPTQVQSSEAASDASEPALASTEEPAEEESAAEATDEPTEEEATVEATEESAEEPAEEDVEDEATARLQVPEGFAINTYFSGLDVPRLMTLGPDGNLYVAEQGGSAVVRLVDADGDGVAEERQVVAENLDGPHSLEWFEESLYVAEFGRVLRLTDQNDDGDMLEEGEQETVTDNIPTGGNHTSRTLHFGPDGKIYVAAGSTGNNNVETDRRRATIMRFNLDGSIPEDNPFADDPDETRRPVWAEGLRNSVDFLFLPDGRLWATHNGSDMLGDDIPPEEIVIEVEKGQHYGWPYCYTPEMGVVMTDTLEVHDERVPFDEHLEDCSDVVPALFTDLAHQAPLGVAYYDRSAFPADYQGSLFVAYHGSWNSSNPRDCKVQEIVVQDGQPVESRPFVTGFRDSEEQQCGDAWGRPAGVAVGANGELFISDDQNGNIYRVIYANEE